MASDYTELLKNLSTEGIDPEVLAKLKAMAGTSRDQLTGLMDYRSFILKAQETLADSGSAIAVSVSVDYLQELNLVSGWVVGDITLCSIANFLKEPPAEDSFSGKVSGSTFITLFRSDEIDEAKEWLKSIQQEIAKMQLPGLDILPEEHLTLSAGIYPFSVDNTPVDKALIEVKKRLKFAQSSGGNTISVITGDNIDVSDNEIDIVCLVKKSQSKNKTETNVVQISLHGLTFESPEPFMVREEISIRLEFDGKKVQLVGEVAWRRSSSDDAEFPFNIGVKFNTIDDRQKSTLEHLMS